MKILYINGVNEQWNNIVAEKFPKCLTEENPEIIISNGGDGTVLSTFRHMNKELKLNVPIMVLRGGTFNFLPTDFQGDFLYLMNTLKYTPFEEFQFYMYEFKPLEVHLSKNDKTYMAINDIILGNNINDYHEINIKTESNILKDITFKGMGICVCSSIGSTGFHLNNRGQIFDDDKSFGISNIVSNININDIVNSDYVKLSLVNSRNKINLFIDGRMNILNITKGQEITIKHTDTVCKLAYLEPDELINRKIASTFANRRKI